MFANLGLFKNLSCPQSESCTRINCPFSHSQNIPPPKQLNLLPQSQNPAKTTPASVIRKAPESAPLVPTKRPAVPSPQKPLPLSQGPPRKLQKVGTSAQPRALPSSARSESDAPVLRVTPAQSLVPVPVRQTMLKTLYDHFVTLYKQVLPTNPTLAAEHALRQEEEVYTQSTKLTYRNAVIQSVAALKRRPAPDNINHPSIGTDGDLTRRAEEKKALESLKLSAELLEPLIHSVSDLKTWGYFVEIPLGPGGDAPSLEGKIAKCERCTQYYVVKPLQETGNCTYHWGKPYTTRVNGERQRTYTCCSRSMDSEGCSQGVHVFYESAPEELHSRHAFSFLPSPFPNRTALDVAALDCEMVYSTGGFRVARVSVVDGSGQEVFDEVIKMDDGVDVIDLNTRFSGISEEKYASASRTLASVREALNALIDTQTILIGHALDNDLKTLRIIHHRCIDTAILFPHRAGLPYRRSLRELVRENLGRLIQTGDATQGHSSIEDASATLDLVRWLVMNGKQTSSKPPNPSS
ncbi:Rexo1 protein [Panaeolus papilionaceus]|nr:Rexo1 protein [Panaeolus papilionaceus]